ncbi:prepilin-type N-terminal cleavage/methylation domain-containing protein [Idiomarina sp. HP20-50]|uniref:prepilin-type N-terminal cleavage/methylation domain-containing protein n=1 Tax=Idiomarina sp. HP20-50 TaxID=3070813 RepID=UPI00294B5B1C|nr:prepilin-type N-terminal cleavage/methylation domain-containing protein [Idiomarina sp. HP20-50]MDV6316950.1 prepilin-type N-terminal cleavage/methylation domain-containing protein [Idiomarina sp. HP20-50]
MRGYSLIELVIALAISAILGAFALPVFHQQTTSLLLQRETIRWLLYLQQVQAKSKSQNIATEANLAAVINKSGNAGVDTESTYNAASPLIFDGESATANPGHIKLKSRDREVKVIISSKGRIRTCLSQGRSLPGLATC